MGGNGHEIDAQLREADWNLAQRLNRIGMQNRTMGPAKLRNTAQRLDGARFIVGQHDAHQSPQPATFQQGVEGDEVDNAGPVHRYQFQGQLPATRCLNDARMLDRGSDQPFYRQAANGEIVGLGAARSEHDHRRRHGKAARENVTRVLHYGARRPAFVVN